jgi:hypothetical protein
VHQTVRRRLGEEPFVGAPPELRDRIMAAVAAAPAVHAMPTAEPRVRPWFRNWILLAIATVLVVGGVVASNTLFTGNENAATVGRLTAAPSSVPLVSEVLANYRRVTAGDLPGRARDLDAVRSAVPFPIEPLRGSGIRLLAAWTTQLVDEPAAVLAYRWDDRIIVEYLVAERPFFQHPAIRSAVSGHRVFIAADGAQGIVGWPTADAGALLVGDVPPERLARIHSEEPLARSVERGAQ